MKKISMEAKRQRKKDDKEKKKTRTLQRSLRF
uniref:Uncharacterized protein n=1 Tax=Cucumis melo TaxID=3656 RepID=A0A9I9ECH1_CUCME